MNDKDNELDKILNEYSSTISTKKSSSIDDLDTLLGDVSLKKNNSFNSTETEPTYEDDFDNEDMSVEYEKQNEFDDDENNNDDLTTVMSLSVDDEDDEDEVEKSYEKPLKIKTENKKSKSPKTKVNSSIFVALIVVCVVLTVSFAVAIFGINMGMEYLGVGKKDVVITLNIPSGADSSDITNLLYENGLIENKTLFKITLKIKKAGASLKPGDVTLKPSMGYDSIIQELCTMRESYETVSITFREGISLYEVAQLLQENDVCSADDFIYEFNSENFGYDYENAISTSAEKFYKNEGLFFPETYSFYVGDSAYNVVRKIREQFENVMIENDLYSKIEKSGMSLEEVIILASIVQGEAANTEDMKNVASVFINRLNAPEEFPKLQSDATDNYYTNVIAPQNGDTTSLEMFRDAYDTYAKNGLPSGAIGNPGLDAIMAVVDAPKTNYYYFCSNLSTKECFFAETLSEHEENLIKAGLV